MLEICLWAIRIDKQHVSVTIYQPDFIPSDHPVPR